MWLGAALQAEVSQRRVAALKPPPAEPLAAFLESRGLMPPPPSEAAAEGEAARGLRCLFSSLIDALEAGAAAVARGERPPAPPAAQATLAALLSLHGASAPELLSEVAPGLVVMLPTLMPVGEFGGQRAESLAAHVEADAARQLGGGSGGGGAGPVASAGAANSGAGTEGGIGSVAGSVQPGVPVLLRDVGDALLRSFAQLRQLDGGARAPPAAAP